MTRDIFDSESLPAQTRSLLRCSLEKLHKYLPRCVRAKGSRSVKLLVFNNWVYTDELYVTIGSIYRGTYQIQRVNFSCVGRCIVAFFMWRFESVRVRTRILHHGQEHVKDLFRQYFASLLRNLEFDILKYIRFRGDTYAIFLTYFYHLHGRL